MPFILRVIVEFVLSYKCIHTHSSFQITANVKVLYKAYFLVKNKHKIDWGSLWNGRIFSKRNSKSVPCVCIHAFLFQHLFIRNIMQLIVLRKPVLNSLTVCFNPCIVCKSGFSLKRISKILKITLIMTVMRNWQVTRKHIFSFKLLLLNLLVRVISTIYVPKETF